MIQFGFIKWQVKISEKTFFLSIFYCLKKYFHMIESPLLPSQFSYMRSLANPKMNFEKITETLGINRFNVRVYLFIALFFYG